MVRTIKALGLGMLASLAFGCLSIAPAEAANFTASSYPTSYTGESAKGNDTLITEAGKVECKSHYAGTSSASSATITVTVTYSSCQAFGFLGATVKTDCHFLLHLEGSSLSLDALDAAIDVACPGGGSIWVFTPSESSPICTMRVNAQTGLKKVTITNNTAAGDVSIKAAVTGIAYEVTQDGFGCPFNGTGKKTGAEYKQDSAITVDSTNGATIDVG